MDNQPLEPQGRVREDLYVFDGPALAVPPEQRIRAKKYARFDDPVIPRSYWYVTAAIAVTAVVLGLLAGRFLLP
jgi:hypothetical protein